MRLVVLTANEPRHRFYLRSVQELFDVALVIREAKRDLVKAGDTSGGDTLMKAHLSSRHVVENRFFPDLATRQAPELNVSPGEVNNPHVTEAVRAARPDLILLYGTSIIREPLLSLFPNILNMHLGLSPYYRGAATNFWPLVNGEPECVGVTIHWANAKVDAGPIVHQVRPTMAEQDGPHEIGCRAIQSGVEGLLKTLDQFKRHGKEALPAAIQSLSGGHVFRRKDFSEASVARMRDNFHEGMIACYLEQKPQRDAPYPIVNL